MADPIGKDEPSELQEFRLVREVVNLIERELFNSKGVALQYPMRVAPASSVEGVVARPGLLDIIGSFVACQTGLNRPIELRRCKVDHKRVRAVYACFTDKVVILYADKLNGDIVNRCWTRFAICKEASHLLLSRHPAYIKTTAEEGIHLLEEILAGTVEDPHIKSEGMGFNAAMELLLPWKLRAKIEAMRDTRQTDFDIATHCRVPEKYVSLMLRGGHEEWSRDINQRLDEEDEQALNLV